MGRVRYPVLPSWAHASAEQTRDELAQFVYDYERVVALTADRAQFRRRLDKLVKAMCRRGYAQAVNEAANTCKRLARHHAKENGEPRPDPDCEFQLAWDEAAALILADMPHDGVAEPEDTP